MKKLSVTIENKLYCVEENALTIVLYTLTDGKIVELVRGYDDSQVYLNLMNKITEEKKDIIQGAISKKFNLPLNEIDWNFECEYTGTYYEHYFDLECGGRIKGIIEKFISTTCFAIDWEKEIVFYNFEGYLDGELDDIF